MQDVRGYSVRARNGHGVRSFARSKRPAVSRIGNRNRAVYLPRQLIICYAIARYGNRYVERCGCDGKFNRCVLRQRVVVQRRFERLLGYGGGVVARVERLRVVAAYRDKSVKGAVIVFTILPAGCGGGDGVRRARIYKAGYTFKLYGQSSADNVLRFARQIFRAVYGVVCRLLAGKSGYGVGEACFRHFDVVADEFNGGVHFVGFNLVPHGCGKRMLQAVISKVGSLRPAYFDNALCNFYFGGFRGQFVITAAVNRAVLLQLQGNGVGASVYHTAACHRCGYFGRAFESRALVVAGSDYKTAQLILAVIGQSAFGSGNGSRPLYGRYFISDCERFAGIVARAFRSGIESDIYRVAVRVLYGQSFRNCRGEQGVLVAAVHIAAYGEVICGNERARFGSGAVINAAELCAVRLRKSERCGAYRKFLRCALCRKRVVGVLLFYLRLGNGCGVRTRIDCLAVRNVARVGYKAVKVYVLAAYKVRRGGKGARLSVVGQVFIAVKRYSNRLCGNFVNYFKRSEVADGVVARAFRCGIKRHGYRICAGVFDFAAVGNLRVKHIVDIFSAHAARYRHILFGEEGSCFGGRAVVRTCESCPCHLRKSERCGAYRKLLRYALCRQRVVGVLLFYLRLGNGCGVRTRVDCRTVRNVAGIGDKAVEVYALAAYKISRGGKSVRRAVIDKVGILRPAYFDNALCNFYFCGSRGKNEVSALVNSAFGSLQTQSNGIRICVNHAAFDICGYFGRAFEFRACIVAGSDDKTAQLIRAVIGQTAFGSGNRSRPLRGGYDVIVNQSAGKAIHAACKSDGVFADVKERTETNRADVLAGDGHGEVFSVYGHVGNGSGEVCKELRRGGVAVHVVRVDGSLRYADFHFSELYGELLRNRGESDIVVSRVAPFRKGHGRSKRHLRAAGSFRGIVADIHAEGVCIRFQNTAVIRFFRQSLDVFNRRTLNYFAGNAPREGYVLFSYRPICRCRTGEVATARKCERIIIARIRLRIAGRSKNRSNILTALTRKHGV